MVKNMRKFERDTKFWRLVSKFEKRLILKTLRKFHGNVAQTADALEINRTTLFMKIKQHKIDLDTLRCHHCFENSSCNQDQTGYKAKMNA